MKWRVRLLTKRKRKRAFRLKAHTIEELVEKLNKHAGKFEDFVLETPVNDPIYWKSKILHRLFQKTHSSEPILF